LKQRAHPAQSSDELHDFIVPALRLGRIGGALARLLRVGAQYQANPATDALID